MHAFMRPGLRLGLTAVTLAVGGTALAAPPRIRLMPPKNTGFLVDQRFDIRAEATTDTGRTLTGIALYVDGTLVPASPQLFTDLASTKSATLRKFSWLAPGAHTLSAVAQDSAGETSTLTQNYNVVNPFGTRRPIKNVIILLGDGMGAAHKTAARLVEFGVDEGRVRRDRVNPITGLSGMLAMDTMPNISSILTHSLNSIVTDSAPGMANYVTGSKHQNNQEGVYPDNTSNTAVAGSRTGAFDNPRVEYLGQYMARKYGKSLGIVSTADIEDATPAANMIHTQDRGAGTGICDQYFDERAGSNLRVLMGGGRRWFLPSTTVGSARSNATDYQLPAAVAAALGVPAGTLDPTRDLIGDFTADGYAYAPTRTAMNGIPANANKVLGLFQYGNMNVALDKINGRRGIKPPGRSTTVVQDMLAPDQPMLDEMTSVALRTLNNGNQNGFVLMIEAAHIDKQSHAMDADRAIWETIEFDNAVKKCLDYANQVGDTLVIVTADHECAGFSIIGGINTQAARSASSDAATLDPSTQPIRQSASVLGIYDAAGFPDYGVLSLDGYPVTPDPTRKLAIGFGGSGDRYEDWIAEPVPFNDGIQTAANAAGTLTDPPYRANVTLRLPESLNGMFLRGQANGSGAQAVHTANEIPLYAYSTGGRASAQFFGLLDNTDVFFLLAKALLGGY